jgi:hypothetical protein
MKKTVLSFFFLFLPAICYAQPSIVFDTQYHDFGTVNPGDTIEYTFDFTNAGDRELVVEKLVPS